MPHSTSTGSFFTIANIPPGTLVPGYYQGPPQNTAFQLQVPVLPSTRRVHEQVAATLPSITLAYTTTVLTPYLVANQHVFTLKVGFACTPMHHQPFPALQH
ncbi:hypothetical protein COCVIDRAFT_13359 [Bipolaris victoriae FI3]|uniref:Uncharacterized protein n=1 Tax=Bipolaris victoriae (strain FI3) TaxID=930091 RepID=W7EQ42_BIPV3|nr:hypothetical protein COCVIDRAFT_13359 [Bipolaris victoriae FI3]